MAASGTDRNRGVDLAQQDLQAVLTGGGASQRVGFTGLRRHVEGLTALTESLAAIVRGVADPMFVATPDLTIVYMNQACAEATGWSVEEVVGKRKCGEVFRANICQNNCALKACMGSRKSVSGVRVTIQNRRGDPIPVVASASPIISADGAVIGGMEIVRNITEDVAREQAAADREEYAQSVIQGISDPFFIVDENLLITYMNDACARAVGYAAADVVGKRKCRDVFRANICDTSCAIKRCMKTGEAISGHRVTIHNRAGDAIPVVVSAAAIRDSSGRAIGGYELVRAIVNEVEVEQSVREASTQVTQSSQEMSRVIGDTATVSEEVARSVERIAREMEGVAARSSELTDLAEANATRIADAESHMGEVRRAVDELLAGMRELNGRADEIGSITRVIETVAQQTNLLALNAAIEAARAGEHGRGFAVVAQEVRKLAEQASEATGGISSLVRTIQSLIGQRVSDAEASAAALEQAGRGVAEVVRGFEAMREGVEGTQTSATEVSAITQEVSAATEEMNATFEEISASAAELAGLAGELLSAAERLGA